MSESDHGERTEEATPEKKRKARDEGQFPRSKDGGSVAASIAVVLCLMVLGAGDVARVREFAVYCFGSAESFVGGNIVVTVQRLAGLLLWLIVPIAVAAAIGGIAVGMLESGLLFRFELVEPKWERLNPITRFGQLLSPKQGSLNVLSALARVVVVGFVTYWIVADAMPVLVSLSRAELLASVTTVLKVGLRLAVWSTIALTGLALLDYGQSFLRLKNQLMMTREELKEEFKQQEGDPKIKARQRARARELLKRGIAKELKRSDVVVANPTHICVALRYRPSEGAPVVTAKGYDEVAFYVRRLAKEYGIPVIENKPLARALAESTRVGRMIPVDLYQAVAQVLALVYRMRSRGLRG